MRAEHRLRLPPNSARTPQNFGEEKWDTTETTKTAISQISTLDLRRPPQKRATNLRTNENNSYASPPLSASVFDVNSLVTNLTNVRGANQFTWLTP